MPRSASQRHTSLLSRSTLVSVFRNLLPFTPNEAGAFNLHVGNSAVRIGLGQLRGARSRRCALRLCVNRLALLLILCVCKRRGVGVCRRSVRCESVALIIISDRLVERKRFGQ